MIGRLAKAEALLSDLVSFASLSGLPNRPIVEYIKSYLEQFDVPVLLDAHGDGIRFNLIATIGQQRDGGILLSGHLDVVPANPEGWSHDPFVLHAKNGRLYGRGAVDMKGFLAIVLAMVPDFVQEREALALPLHLVFTFDEEVGSFGAVQIPDFLNRHGIKPAIAIIGEPTGMTPFLGHKGGLELITEISGNAGHASDPRGKVNALYYAARMITFIETKAAELAACPRPLTPFNPPYSTISVGQVSGGEARNIIAGQCRFLWEIRPLPEDDPRQILEEIEQFVSSTLVPEMQAIFPGAGIETIVDSWCPGMKVRPKSAAARLIARLWTNQSPAVASFGTDGGHFQMAGIETVVFGPGEMDQMHQPDEFIERAALADGLQFLLALLGYMKSPD